jgi:hypothetical protein
VVQDEPRDEREEGGDNQYDANDLNGPVAPILHQTLAGRQAHAAKVSASGPGVRSYATVSVPLR